jgi:hypothetical protein
MYAALNNAQRRTEVGDEGSEFAVQFADINQRGGKFFGGAEISAGGEGVVMEGEGNPVFSQAVGRKVMTVEVKLKAERHPSRYAQITQVEVRFDKVKIIMQALTVIRFKECSLRRRDRFQGKFPSARYDRNKTRQPAHNLA